MRYKKIKVYSLFLLCILIISIGLSASKLNKESSNVEQEKEVGRDNTDIPAIEFSEVATKNINLPAVNKEAEDNITLSESNNKTEDNSKAEDSSKAEHSSKAEDSSKAGDNSSAEEIRITEDNSLPAFKGKEVMKIYVIGDIVHMRKQPTTQSEIMDILDYGTEVQYLSDEEGWTKLQYREIQGYIRNDLLSTEIPSPQPETELMKSTLPDRESLNNPSILVKKSERTLELWDGNTLIGSYPIGLGWEPVGDKQREGDGRTPEGSYYVCVRNSNSRFYLSLGVSYPNKEDAKEALEEERIDQNTYEQITAAIDNNTQPPWYTPLGGEIMIHGMGSSSDWTAGCIAVENDVMDILWKYCPKKTPITILP